MAGDARYMAGDGRVEPDMTAPRLDVEFPLDDKSIKKVNNMYDRVILQILEDSAKENDGPLRILGTTIWDPNNKIVEFDVKNSEILEYMYGRFPRK